ncbi:indoleamine 2,3-dioxygenase 2 [Aplysia californica]|uniref:Indoleamine 2,3-dioxygenase 2 n=1 Tax=Aplysia californica TaxID=6500 RepID=A0ABM0KAU6_APLCA|nr:indoleamine 2,3-dioxygenase 2 [Aplysia californica]
MVFSLEKYQLSPKCGFTAFLPESLGEYYKAWHDLAAKAVNLVTAGTMRQECLKLPQLDSSSLTEYGELRLAHLQLCIITCGYVWEQGTGAPPVPLLPACVAVPFHDVSKKLGMTPVITHSDVAANWELIDEDGPLTRDNFRVRYMMPGGQEFVDFTTLVVEMDVHYTKILPTLQKMGKTASPKQVAEALQEVTIIARKNRELSAEFKSTNFLFLNSSLLVSFSMHVVFSYSTGIYPLLKGIRDGMGSGLKSLGTRMNAGSESRKEDICRKMEGLNTAKTKVITGLWNVRTMYETGKLAQVTAEMRRYGLHVLGISESHWTGSGRLRTATGETLIYSGREDNQHRKV